jgi:phosphoglycerol geranylgeranyltransferase
MSAQSSSFPGGLTGLPKRGLALLFDPDRFDPNRVLALLPLADLVLVGGSVLTHGSVQECVGFLKTHSPAPTLIFPGNGMHLDGRADGLLLLSLVSGRNPELLIGQHVQAAPQLNALSMRCFPTGYILIDGGKPTTVSYISNTTPIPHDKPELAAATALAAALLGMQVVYLDAGSGADRPVPPATIAAVRKSVSLPIFVGGGIRSAAAASAAWKAGADWLVVGTAGEQSHHLVEAIAQEKPL